MDSSTISSISEISSDDLDTSDKLLDQLAEEYGTYVKIDVATEKKALEESIDDLLTRLDEFCGLMDMIRCDDTLCLTHTLPDIYKKSYEMDVVYDKIDKLEAFVNVVRGSIDAMEEKVAEAENVLGGNSVKKFLSSLQKPLFAKKQPQQYKKQIKYEAPEIFRTCDYLASVSEDDPLIPTSISNISLDTVSDRSVEEEELVSHP